MNPSVPDRLSSAIRALSYVVLPALPPEASLAREQTQLVIGHLQITLAQYAATPAFEQQEADDFRDLAITIAQLSQGGLATVEATHGLTDALEASKELPALAQTDMLQKAIDVLLIALVEDGEGAASTAIKTKVLEQATHRADVDRRWFSLMGFDPEILETMQAA
jgi:hypothetical protein